MSGGGDDQAGSSVMDFHYRSVKQTYHVQRIRTIYHTGLKQTRSFLGALL